MSKHRNSCCASNPPTIRGDLVVHEEDAGKVQKTLRDLEKEGRILI